jgi:tripartite-type tricarboxylate transporter receptor subunit TctC
MQWIKIVASALTLMLVPPGAAAQQAYPNKPIRIYVGSSPGAPSDVLARVLSDKLAARYKQPVMVENRPGAGNNLAAAQTAKSDPDGYTILVSPDTVLTVNPLVYRKLDFNARNDLVPVSLLASFSQMLVCGTVLKITDVTDLVARAKKAKMTYASGGQGVPGHLAAEMFLTATGIDMDHVPYRGPGPALADVLGGLVDCGFLTTPSVLAHVKSGRLTALAVSSIRPSPLAPEIPTLAQVTGKPQLDATFNQYLFVPRGTPAAVVNELQRASAEILKDPAVRGKLTALDMTSVGSSSTEATKTLNGDIEKWHGIVKGMNLRLDD